MEQAERSGVPEEERRSIFGSSTLKRAAFDGDLAEGKAEMGQSAGLVSRIMPAADIVREIANEYLATVNALPGRAMLDAAQRPHGH